MNYRWAIGVLALCACSVEATDAADEATVSSESAAYSGTDYTASSGATSLVNMGVASGRACFLTMIKGKFYTASDSATVFRSGGRWYLQVSSTAPGGVVVANATCVPGTVSHESAPVHSNSSVTLNPSDPWGSCFLSHVAGHFGGSGDRVLITRDGNGYWTLQSSSTTSGGLEGSAVCISSQSPQFLWNGGIQDSWAWNGANRLLLNDANHVYACFLQGMRGMFKGYDESVSAFYYNQQDNLNGHQGALGGSIAAWAGCIAAP